MDDKNEPIIVLSASEIQAFKDIVGTISVDDLKYIKEYADDRRAISRVFSRVKNFTLTTAAIVVAYFAITRSVLPPLREMLVKFLQGTN